MKMRRRDALKTMGAMAGAASLSRLLAACGGGGGDKGITTWVFMMMENRSYDHYLGARALEGLPGDGLMAGMSNDDMDGVAVPIYAQAGDEPSMCVADPPHGWDPSRVQFDSGANDGFVRAYQEKNGHREEVMAYMTRDRLPVTWALADAYTICDRWFCSVLGPTLPNRMYWHAATSNRAKSNDEVLAGAFEGLPSLYHRLEAAGIPWAYYFGDAPVLGVLKDIDLDGKLRRFWYDFIDDAAAGVLPPVVYIDPGFARNDDHPPHHPLLGQQLISAVYTALTTGPHKDNFNLVLTYDENGGFFDHVPPPTAPDDFAADGFDQLGFRVPGMVIGPYAKAGYVSSVQYDHTSALKHVENLFGLEPLTMRDAAATDLIDCLDLDRLERGEPLDPIELPAVEIDETMLGPECSGSSLRPVPDGLPDWAAGIAEQVARRDPRLLQHNGLEQVHGIAEYLDRHGLGRIRRGR